MGQGNMGTFAGQVAVITGASRGMGKAIALKLAAAGATLCLIGSNQKALQKTAQDAKAPLEELDNPYAVDVQAPCRLT